jgi:hypothetical protein
MKFSRIRNTAPYKVAPLEPLEFSGSLLAQIQANTQKNPQKAELQYL